MKNDYYVYSHTKPDGTIFYIGKGRARRAYRKCNRSLFWKRVSKDGYSVSIIRRGLTEVESFRIESNLIHLIGRRDLNTGTLVNHTYGGEGTSGHKHTDDFKKKASIRNKGKVLSEDHKKKISKSSAGKVIPESHKTALRKLSRGVICLDDNIIHESTGAAAIFYGIKSNSLVWAVCVGRSKTSKGLRFMYLDDYENQSS